MLSTLSVPISSSVCKFSFTVSTQNKLFGNENKTNDQNIAVYLRGKTKFSQPVYKETIEAV